MAIKELTAEQVRTLTLEQKDQWWLKEVYQGDMPQLNLRSALTGTAIDEMTSGANGLNSSGPRRCESTWQLPRLVAL